jgi:cytochrome c2
MNYEEFIQTEIPYQNEFRLNWYRVNGVYSETTGQIPEQHRLYVSHNGYDSTRECITFDVSTVDLEIGSSLNISGGEWSTLFTASPCINPEPEAWLGYRAYAGNISGGRIIEYDEDMLLVSVGDYNHHGLNGMPAYAMDESNPYGKFLLMDKETGEYTIYAKGSRNASGLFKDRSGTVWSAENGPRGGDELNIIEEENNYGWPNVSYGVWYSPEFQLKDHLRGTHPMYDKPVFSWVPSIAPSNIIRIEGEKFEHWQGDLIIGTMGDQSLRRLRIKGERSVVYDERIHIGHRIRDVTLLPDGKFAAITDDSFLIIFDDGGPLYREMNGVEKQRLAELEKLDRITSGNNVSTEIQETRSAELIFDRKCGSCHNLTGESQIGPHLQNIYERQVGGLENYPYSNTLQSDDRIWTAELTKQFLLNPDQEFSGSRMVQVELSEAEADSLIRFLEQ